MILEIKLVKMYYREKRSFQYILLTIFSRFDVAYYNYRGDHWTCPNCFYLCFTSLVNEDAETAGDDCK